MGCAPQPMILCCTAHPQYQPASKSKGSSFLCYMLRPHGSSPDRWLSPVPRSRRVVLTPRAGRRGVSHIRDRRSLPCTCLFTHRLPVIDGILRALDRSGWMLLDFIENYRHGLFELGIVPRPPGCRIELDVDIRRNTLVLDIELAGIRIE